MEQISYRELINELQDHGVSPDEFFDAISDEISIHAGLTSPEDVGNFLATLDSNQAARILLAHLIGVNEISLMETLKDIIASMSFKNEVDITLYGNKSIEDDEDTVLEIEDADEIRD